MCEDEGDREREASDRGEATAFCGVTPCDPELGVCPGDSGSAVSLPPAGGGGCPSLPKFPPILSHWLSLGLPGESSFEQSLFLPWWNFPCGLLLGLCSIC